MKKRKYITGTKISEDCLSCAASMSEESAEENGSDKLYCTEKQKYVKDFQWCKNYN